MSFRSSVKQALRAPVKLICFLLICALSAALLCIGLNLNENAKKNIAATDAAFVTIAVPKLFAYVDRNGNLVDDINNFDYIGYIECASRDYDLSLIENSSAVEKIDVRGRFGAKVNSENYLEYGNVLQSAQVKDIIIFKVGSDEQITIRPYSPAVSVPVTVEYSASGYTDFAENLNISSFLNIYNYSGAVRETEDGTQIPTDFPEFEIGTESEDGSFYLEPGKTYIASVNLEIMQQNDANGNPIGDNLKVLGIIVSDDNYHCETYYEYQNRTWAETYTSEPMSQMPIALYSDDFFDTERGMFFKEAIDAYIATANSLTAITTSDADSMLPFHSGGVYVSDGRKISEDEYLSGAKVCLVSDYMAECNGWSVGDKLSLSFYEAKYNFTMQYLQSKFAAPTTDYFDEGEYEIVGIFSGNVRVSQNISGYSMGEGLYAKDVIIPTSSVTGAPAPEISSYSTSIRLINDKAEDFLTELAQSGLTEEQNGGYQLEVTVYDQGYSAFAPGIKQLSSIGRTMLILSLAVAALSAILLAVIHFLQKRREIAFMRSLGVKRGQVVVIVAIGLALVCLIGAAIGAAAGSAFSAKVTEAVLQTESAEETDGAFSTAQGEGEYKDFEYILDSNPAYAVASAVSVSVVFLIIIVLLTLNEYRKSPMLLLGEKE